MHLLTLVIQELESPLVSVLQENNVINSVLQLIDTCVPVLELGKTSATPQWMATVLLIIDQCEKAAVSSRRKAESKRVLVSCYTFLICETQNHYLTLTIMKFVLLCRVIVVHGNGLMIETVNGIHTLRHLILL